MVMKKTNIGKVIFYSIVGIGILSIILVNVQELNKNKYVRKDYKITKGFVKSVNDIGVESKSFLSYYYFVESRRYERTIRVSREFENCCDDKNNKCCTSIFWVIYSTKKHDRSLINISLDLQDIENPEFPESIANFN